VGQSTGGFTDCLLQQGAAMVVGVDVGSAQLHPSLRADPRVLCVEGVNARALDASDLIAAYEDSISAGGQFDIENEEAIDRILCPSLTWSWLTCRLSRKRWCLPAVVPLLKAGGTLLTLVKPQFELQPGQVGKGGIVKDAALYQVVEQRLREACAEPGSGRDSMV
jgi:23S rRNA (cytidine1920-2'-O)/16S rRNA (cytidine1409-2'-O)-methyltransferase